MFCQLWLKLTCFIQRNVGVGFAVLFSFLKNGYIIIYAVKYKDELVQGKDHKNMKKGEGDFGWRLISL